MLPNGIRISQVHEWWRGQPLPQKCRMVAVGLVVILLGLGLLFLPEQPRGGESGGRGLPDFSRYADGAARKDAFLSYLLPLVQAANGEIARDRERLLQIRCALARQRGPTAPAGEPAFSTDVSPKPLPEPAALAALPMSGADVRWLWGLARDYALALPAEEATAQTEERTAAPPAEIDLGFIDQLLLRVDTLPPSLVLAQAAIESAWGTSRFARQGNNLFGLRSYDGRGLVPRRRAAGARFRVAIYASPRDSVRAYFQTLNTQPAYHRLWALRAEARRSGQPLSGLRLADGLSAYSERGEAYVRQVKALIRDNPLDRIEASESPQSAP
ncbi:glucosaminidase domain-containing protein [Cephaloticoccus primus]|nr:glucosaminidase domain-containing protein [Cephaloticoccus primus]